MRRRPPRSAGKPVRISRCTWGSSSACVRRWPTWAYINLRYGEYLSAEVCAGYAAVCVVAPLQCDRLRRSHIGRTPACFRAVQTSYKSPRPLGDRGAGRAHNCTEARRALPSRRAAIDTPASCAPGGPFPGQSWKTIRRLLRGASFGNAFTAQERHCAQPIATGADRPSSGTPKAGPSFGGLWWFLGGDAADGRSDTCHFIARTS
jgi:hypothetical protein